jgi:gamma-glutamyltranspeptidase / glutathione hydrolase
MSRKRYADTLLQIGEYGPAALYSREIAETIVAGRAASAGIMTLDLRTYKVISRPSRSIDYHGYRIHSYSSPCGGIVALDILNTLKGYGGTGDEANMNLTTHRLDEAMRFAYGAVRGTLNPQPQPLGGKKGKKGRKKKEERREKREERRKKKEERRK